MQRGIHTERGGLDMWFIFAIESAVFAALTSIFRCTFDYSGDTNYGFIDSLMLLNIIKREIYE